MLLWLRCKLTGVAKHPYRLQTLQQKVRHVASAVMQIWRCHTSTFIVDIKSRGQNALESESMCQWCSHNDTSSHSCCGHQLHATYPKHDSKHAEMLVDSWLANLHQQGLTLKNHHLHHDVALASTPDHCIQKDLNGSTVYASQLRFQLSLHQRSRGPALARTWGSLSTQWYRFGQYESEFHPCLSSQRLIPSSADDIHHSSAMPLQYGREKTLKPFHSASKQSTCQWVNGISPKDQSANAANEEDHNENAANTHWSHFEKRITWLVT